MKIDQYKISNVIFRYTVSSSLLSSMVLITLLGMSGCGGGTATSDSETSATAVTTTVTPMNADSVVTAGEHTCAVLNDSTMKCWGGNYFGQLGQGSTENLGNKSGDEISEIAVGTGQTVVRATVGGNHTCAILNDFSVKCWGWNAYGQLGQGNGTDLGGITGDLGDNLIAINVGTNKTVTAVTAGENHTCALLNDSTVKCWGDNFYGQLGQSNTDPIGETAGDMGDNISPVNLDTGKTVVKIAAGAFHNCAVLNDSTVKCWGHNGSGRLGQGTTTNLGNAANQMGANLSTINLGSSGAVNKTAINVAAGEEHSCAILNDSTVKCWGGNYFGQLGQGHGNSLGDDANEMGNNLSIINLGTNKTAIKIVAGAYHTCAILNDSSVKCWGENTYGQLGQGHSDDLGVDPDQMGENLSAILLGEGKTAVDIAAGGEQTCVVLNDATVKCFGDNGRGQLGQRHENVIGASMDEMGDNLSPISL